MGVPKKVAIDFVQIREVALVARGGGQILEGCIS